MRNKLQQVHIHGQWMLPSLMHSFVGQSSTKKKKREKFYIYLDVTHTPGRSRVNPERQKEEKGEHRRRAEGQNSAGGGGEQTDLQNQPTRRNGPDQNSAHT